MASSIIVKGVSSIITPIKASRLNLTQSPLNIQRKALSATSKNTVSKVPNFGSCNRYCTTSKSKECSISSEERSSLPYKAVRCLFSPQTSPKSSTTEELSPAPGGINSRHRILPSFDTPLRKSISAKQFCTRSNKSYVLGRGSFGLVVEGRYKNKRIAVKVMSQCQEQTEMLKSEINALKLDHPNIIKVFQVILGPDENIGFVFMELYSKTNLEHILQYEIVHHLDKLRYLEQIGSALHYCHSNGILHLDVKPKNIIVKTKNKICKLCDFGSSFNKCNLKGTNGYRKGTLKYTAPELLRGDNPTEKSDVYSFGITMWQTIYQEVPYDQEDLQQVVYKVVKHNYRPASYYANIYNMRAHHIYEACWQTEPQQRPSMFHVLLLMGKLRHSNETFDIV